MILPIFMKFLIKIQVNLCQKHLFLQQLTHNMSKDCSLNYNMYNVYFSLERQHDATFHPFGILRHHWLSMFTFLFIEL